MNDDTLSADIGALEDRLADAMRRSDVAVLDELLADDLVFTNHLGQRIGKQDDLAVHASGLLKIQTLDATDLQLRLLGDTAVVAVRVQLAGTHADQAFAGAFRFTRVWALRGGRWQVVVAQATAIAG